jgi:glycosyltransferase involved in cell wall biosynthesis
MVIAIDASKLEIQDKTGTEYYAQDLIRGLLQSLSTEHSIILYSHKALPQDILTIHPNTQNHIIKNTFLWTLWGLSLALLKDKPDRFYTPASIIPPIHPKRSIIVIHGLEYEAFPQAYSLFRFWHLAIFTKLSARWAHKIITPTASTKEDLSSEYEIKEDKIIVIPSGIPQFHQNKQDMIRPKIDALANREYIFTIGRKELRKNLITLIDAFELVKKDKPELKLVLAGNPGYGYRDIASRIQKSSYKQDIIELNRVNNTEKLVLYQNATIFAYPSYYEGFGFPILEALEQGIPVIASDIPSSREVGGDMIQYVEVDNISAWANSLREILDLKPQEDIVIKRKEYTKQFNFTDTINKTKDIILE